MEEVVWTSVFAAVAGIGALIAIRSRSRAWTVAGVAYGLGGLGLAAYEIILPYPPVGTATDVAVWAQVLGGPSVFVGMVATLVALGRGGRRRFLVLFAAVTLAVATYQFWTTNWPARFGEVRSYCTDQSLDFRGGPVQRVPPGVTCYDRGQEEFVPADSLSWVALGGWSLFYGFVLTFPVMGFAWLITWRRPLTPASAQS
jgi:hypothetical protein